MTEWRELQFRTAIEAQRALNGYVVQFALGLIVAVVTISGFAIERESWGLAILALVFDVVLILAIVRFRTATRRLLAVAMDIESKVQGGPRVTKAIQQSTGLEFVRLSPFLVVSVAATLVHFALVVYVANSLEWKFSGK